MMKPVKITIARKNVIGGEEEYRWELYEQGNLVGYSPWGEKKTIQREMEIMLRHCSIHKTEDLEKE